jgi:hypothetical protein
MRFYFTVHPSDLTRGRLLPGTHGLLVASSLWRNGRLRVRRPPAGVLASLALDSGGFTAARKWGEYPWSVADYARWARILVAERPVDWVATMDYACEPGVNRQTWATNRQRIAATVAQARRCLDAAPALPWLPVVQGYTVEDYAACIAHYQTAGIPLAYAGLGTMCGRPVREARRILRTLGLWYPQIRWHVFGLHLGVLRDDLAAAAVASWDSYAWNWGKGAKHDACRLHRLAGETWSGYCARLAADYQQRIAVLQDQPRTLALFRAQVAPTG